jgi:hypothetical protein
VVAKTLINRVEDLKKVVNSETVGVRGVLNNLFNVVGGSVAALSGKEFTGFNKDVAITKQRIDQLTSDIVGYIRSDSGNMSDRDLTMLKKAAPKFEIGSTVDIVKTQLDELTDLFALKEFIARKELGDVHGILTDRGPASFVRALALGERNGMPKSRTRQLINKALVSIPPDNPDEGMHVLKGLVDGGILSTEEAISMGQTAGLIADNG